MTASLTSPGPVPGYALNPPGEADARAALERVFGAERGAERWADACRAAGLATGRVGTGAPLLRAVEALAGQGGATATVARSLDIRIRTYARLAAHASAPTAGGTR
jgi:hypothetical protein